MPVPPPGRQCEVYPVGLLKDLLFLWGTVRRAPTHTGEAIRKLGTGFRQGWRRKSYWNGHLAEPTSSSVAWARAGHGWTKRRAIRDLDRHTAEMATHRPTEEDAVKAVTP